MIEDVVRSNIAKIHETYTSCKRWILEYFNAPELDQYTWEIILWNEPWERIEADNECWDIVKGNEFLELESLTYEGEPHGKEYRRAGWLLVAGLEQDRFTWNYYLIPEELEVKTGQ